MRRNDLQLMSTAAAESSATIQVTIQRWMSSMG